MSQQHILFVLLCLCAGTVRSQFNDNTDQVPDNVRRLSLPCSCNGELCSCCAQLDISQYNFNQRLCLNISYDPTQVALKVDILLNGASFYSTQISARNPPPICVPIPQVPFIMLCIRFYNIELTQNGIKTCVNLEVKVAGATLLAVSFDCVRVSTTGITLEKPSIPASNRPIYEVETTIFQRPNFFNTRPPQTSR